MHGKHLACLEACLRDDLDTIRTCVRNSRWSWEEFLEQANDHAVLPSIVAALLKYPDLVTSPEVSALLSTVSLLNGERNAAILEETKIVARRLNEIGIKPILLKGVAYLAIGVYPDAATRYLIDIDILLPHGDVAAGAQALLANGFAHDQGDAFARFRHHHPPLRRPNSVSVEIHHRLGMGACDSLLPAGEVIKRSLDLDLDGASVGVPCPQHLMTHLILHSQMQHPYQERIWLPLRAACDLVRLNRRFGSEINWDSIERDFRTAGQHGLLVLHLLQVRDHLGFEMPMLANLSAMVQLRLLRRELLRRIPALRYVDPLYMFSTICLRRMRLLTNVLSHPGGLEYLVSHMLRLPLYARLFSDIVEGRGRS